MPPPPVAQEAEDTSGYGKTRAVFGKFLVGPSVSLLSLPMPAVFSLEGKYDNLVGFSLDYGTIPKFKIQGVEVKADSYRANLRFFPFRQAFFIGLGYGSQSLKASKSETISGSTVNASVDVQSSFFTPQIGWKWLWSSGFFWGMEIGYQIPNRSHVDLQTDAPTAVTSTAEYKRLENDVKDAGYRIGEMGLPHLALIQFGFLL